MVRTLSVLAVLLTTGGAASARPRVPLLEILGTLQRPQTKADLADPGLRRQLRFMARHPALAGKPVRKLVRLATVAPWGEQVFLVPARRGKRLVLSAPAAGGATVPQIKAGCDWGTERSGQLLIVIPDGVAQVKVWPRRTLRRKHPPPLIATVHNNIAAFESRQNLDEPRREVWYGLSGQVIKRIAEPAC